jgi:hypothetical protein
MFCATMNNESTYMCENVAVRADSMSVLVTMIKQIFFTVGGTKWQTM